MVYSLPSSLRGTPCGVYAPFLPVCREERASLPLPLSRFTVGRYVPVLLSLSLSAHLTLLGKKGGLFSASFPVSLLG